jgi:hypothetical protein
LAETLGIDEYKARIVSSAIKETIEAKATAEEISDTAKGSTLDPVITSIAGSG